MKRIYSGDRRECQRQSAANYRKRNLNKTHKQWVDSRKRQLEKRAGRKNPRNVNYAGELDYMAKAIEFVLTIIILRGNFVDGFVITAI